jgi:hypothetical protein
VGSSFCRTCVSCSGNGWHEKTTVTGIREMGLASDIAGALIAILVTGKPLASPPPEAGAERDE